MTLTAIRPRPQVVADRARRVVERRRRLPRRPVPQLGGRVRVFALIVATGLCGLLFGPVFGSFFALTRPIGAVCAVAYLCYEAARLWPPLERWRPLFTVLLGLLIVSLTTLHRLSPRGLYDGARQSWLLTLQSTWPVHPAARLDAFVPLLVLIALVIGVHILVRTRARLVALLPAVAVALVAQGFQPLSGHAAVPVVIVFAAAAALVLGSLDNVRLAAAVAIPVVVGGAFAGAVIDPAGRAAYSLKNVTTPVSIPTAVTNPLDDIAYRLEHPGTPVFAVHGGDADRWPLAVFTEFDGANWTSTSDYRYLGAALDVDPTAHSERHSARISIQSLPGPWLPSQRGLRSVSGISPLVDEKNGTLLSGDTRPGLTYRVGWAVPDISGSRLADSALAPVSLGSLGRVPAGILQVARTAVGTAGPSFRTALVLERYMRAHYRLAVGRNLPAGHGWPQLLQFLNQTKRGTSEQFAAAYVALARVIGIPARLVVGFRAPSSGNVVRNGDVLAWPEVAVSGVGWIPLDPSGIQRSGASHDSTPLSRATQQARAEVPPPATKRQPVPPRSTPPPTAGHPGEHDLPSIPLAAPAAAVLTGAALWLIGVPLVKEIRAGGRRRRDGNAAVLAAWLEARDRLRDNGIPIDSGMTVRDVAIACHGLVGRSAEHALEQLGHLVDAALWSGGSVGGRGVDAAWQWCDTVRHGLAERRLRSRIAAAVRIRGLRRLH